MEKPNNPPAFARTGYSYEGQQEGMTLRDFFAAAALQGMLASGLATEDWVPKYAAPSAYSIADAMLTQRGL